MCFTGSNLPCHFARRSSLLLCFYSPPTNFFVVSGLIISVLLLLTDPESISSRIMLCAIWLPCGSPVMVHILVGPPVDSSFDLNWTLHPESLCILLIMSPLLPIMTPIRLRGTGICVGNKQHRHLQLIQMHQILSRFLSLNTRLSDTSAKFHLFFKWMAYYRTLVTKQLMKSAKWRTFSSKPLLYPFHHLMNDLQVHHSLLAQSAE